MADIASAFASERGDDTGADMLFWMTAARRSIESHQRDIGQSPERPPLLAARLASLEATARTMALEMGYGFLLDPDRKLLSIGYRVAEGTLDPSCYDLLASEARLASFIAIAKGDVPARHWFHLGRAVTPIAHGAALISWSGSMFEYLMPSLVMRAPAGSLLEQTNRLIVRRQIAYGASLGLPWGVSESAYNIRDLELTYQYSNFGVPGLGLKRGLGENAVVAPYATALASMVDPAAAARNLRRLAGVGACGRYGFYEALDYTPSRLPEDASVAIVRAFMAHHQGMTIVAIADALLDGAMRARFHAEPMVQATELLLQEGTPRDVAVVRPWEADAKSDAKVRQTGAHGGRRLATAHTAALATHLLSNGRYAVMLTAAGSGYSRWRGLAVTRWREDATCDDWGSYVFLRDVRSGDVWSAGFQPSGAEPDAYDVAFNEDRAEITRHDGTLTTTLEVLVSAEDDAEVRRVSITNSGNRVREIDVTSYAELVLAPQADDVAHPAFMKLFVATEYLADPGHHAGDAAAALAGRAGDLGGASGHRGRRGGGEAGGGDRPGPLPRPRPQHPSADRGDRRPAVVQHGRHGARSDLRPAPPRARRARRHRAHRLLDGGCRIPRGGARPGRQASRHHRIRAGGHAGVDPGAGAASSSRHRSGRSRPVPASRRPPAVCRADAAAVLRYHPARRRWTAGALAHGHFRRPADRAAAHRRHREPRHRPPTAAGARVLADEAVRGGSGDPERARVVLCPGSADRARDPGPGEPVATAGRRGATAGPRLRAARRPDFVGGPRAARVGRAGRAGRTARVARRSARPRAGTRRGSPDHPKTGDWSVAAHPACAAGRSSSSTGLAASPKTGGNM